MAEVVQMFLFLYKSKYRRKGQCREVVRDQCGVIAVPWPILWAALICWVVHVTAAASSSSSSLTTETTCDTDSCVNGDCVNGTCVCHEGWQGLACQFCGGKVRRHRRRRRRRRRRCPLLPPSVDFWRKDCQCRATPRRVGRRTPRDSSRRLLLIE